MSNSVSGNHFDIFFAVGLDADAAPPGDVSIQIGLADSYSACEPVSHDVATPHGPVDRISTELQLVSSLLNG